MPDGMIAEVLWNKHCYCSSPVLSHLRLVSS